MLVLSVVVAAVADDDDDDRMLTQEALLESRVCNKLYCVEDGVELIEFLRREGKYVDPKNSPRPGLILLDLNMPRKDGRKFLVELKSNPAISHIPVVVFSNSTHPRDIQIAETLGAFDFITKPDTFEEYQQVFKELGQTILNREVVI